MRHNYAAIGGRSPLTDITLAQAAALRASLGNNIPVAVGMRNWHPFIKDAIADLLNAGVTRIVGVPMAPQSSSLSVKKYLEAAKAAIPDGVPFTPVSSFFRHPQLIDAFAERVIAARPTERDVIVFTAHSLPVSVIEGGDGYADEVAATAQAVAAKAGIARYELAFQSAGRTPEPWIGPELGSFVKERAAAGATSFLIVPVGFVCDHTEILFDIDVQAAAAAREAGASLRRTESLNTSAPFIAMLADLVRHADQ
jgi:ferrochelatase